MRQYLDLLTDVMASSQAKTDRTGTGTRSVFGRMLRCNLADGFPLLTTKKVHFKSVAHELLCFGEFLNTSRDLVRGNILGNQCVAAAR